MFPYMAHPDVPAEQAHVDLAYQRLAAMRAAAQTMLRDAFGERGGTFQALTERDIRVRNSLGRLEQLQLGDEALIFGRIDRAPAEAGGDPEAFHIGRIAVSDANQEPLVVDWRAPVAEPFYRATGAHPMGLVRRRHFLTEGRLVVDLEDELFDPEGVNDGRGLGLSGPQVLLATLERSRTGRMRDIVATVQREQDEIIRAPLPGVLVVQGGPGTGKTAVALHRAAYLLYTHRFPLESQGVLVLGPNPTFLRYIEHVLPSLDETGVQLSTVNGLYPVTRAVAADDPAVTRLKGDPRMARVLARAVADRQRPLRHTAEVPYGRRVLRLTPALSAELVGAVKRRPGPHNARRRTLEQVLWRHLAEQMAAEQDDARRGRVAAGPGAEPGGTEPVSADELGRALRRDPAMVEALDRMWPVLTPEQLVHDLFGARPLIELASAGVLNPAEQALLYRPRGRPDEPVAWTDADIPLLDEAWAILGTPRRAHPDRPEAIRTYGHVVVDETQDLSPMQLRMVARRSLSGSMTVVGDVAQATGPWSPASWNQVVEHLPARREWRLNELTVNYRTPHEIMELAARILEQVAPGMRSPDSVRASGHPPRVVTAARPGGFPRSGQLVESVVATVTGDLRDQRQGTAALIVPPSLLPDVLDALRRSGVPFGTAGREALDQQLTVLTIEDAKGLEFDSVTVVEPGRMAADSPQGMRALYVAFTRATQRLTIVHSEPLPSSLAEVTSHPA
ncbi:MAG TPA: ATP-binding domain-containing protein [Acidimicrobiales bacterium]|nr:ATP-binding domain-containing protein [Acidimicrobiales bacterium]